MSEFEEIRDRFMRDFAMNAHDAGVTASSPELAAYAEACMREAARTGGGSKPVINLIAGEYLARVRELKIPLTELATKTIAPQALVKIAALAVAGKVSAPSAKTLFNAAWDTGKDPDTLLNALGLAQVSDPAQIEAWAKEAIAAQPKAAEALKSGNEKALGPLVGLLLKTSGGKANPKLAGEIIKKLLS